ncbi:MAG: enoyl-CoA hydratase-related protein [Hyphomonadaceae bacterium]|nr:enoyl-CoA hydratase-related protein [Hyphomonadaceae bacterium]
MTQLPPVTALELELKSGWLTIWFNQPDNRNALSAELTGDLLNVLAAVRDDRKVRGITLRGRGGVFCAGADLKAFRSGHQGGASGSREAVMEQSKRGAGMFDAVDTMPQVVIAIIEGAAMAGGFGLACCADVVICEAGAKFAMTETAIGLSPAQISPFVIQKLGFAIARRLMLTAARFDAREAQALGFADFVAEGMEAVEAIEMQIRKQVLKCAPGAVADTKALILALPRLDRTQTVQAAAENFAGRMLSDEGREGVASFVEKRKPKWAVDP